MRAPFLLALWVSGGLSLILPPTLPGAQEATRELVGVLESEASLEAKAIACRKLGEFGSPEAVPALASLLDHEVLGAYARSGLERIPDPSASAALRSALQTTEGDRLVGVITSLGDLRDERAVGPLSTLTRHEDASVGRAALLALGRVGNADAVRVVEAALASGRDGAAAACLLAAEQQRAEGQTDVALALYDAVRSADVPEPARLGATRGAILTRNSVPFLTEQLGSDDPSIRAVALRAIREMPSDALAAALHARLSSAAPALQVQLITALRDCHNSDSFAVVRSQLDSDTPAIRVAALGAVSAVGSGPELAATLLDVVLDRRSPEERQTALDLLTRMEGAPEVDRVILTRLRQAEAVDSRVDVIRVLGSRRTASAVDDLLEQARNEDPRVRLAALRSIRRLVGPKEVEALIALLRTERSDAARTAAVSALVSACGDDGPSGELVLAELRQASDTAEKDAWTRVLTATGYPAALPAILERLEDEDPEVVAATVTHLGRWPDPAPMEALFAILEDGDHPEVQRRACSAVIQLTTNAADRGQRPDGVLVEWFGRANAGVETIQEKRQLISGLARVQTLDSFLVLEPYLKDPEVQTEARYALLAIAPPLLQSGQQAVVKKALPDIPSIEEDDLRGRMARLKEEVDAAE